MYLLIVLFIIWLIIKIWMNEIFLMSDLCVDLLCTNTLVFTWFCNCKLSKNRKCCLPNRVNTQIWIWIRDIRFVFKFVVVFLSKNVVKGVIQIQFHVNSFCFHPYEGGREGGSEGKTKHGPLCVPCSFALSVTRQQYFSLRTNQH
jgi:hypothetical protein